LFVVELQEKIDLLQKEISAAGGAKKIEEKREIVIVVYAKSKKKVQFFSCSISILSSPIHFFIFTLPRITILK
jgi:hypothetical protein